MDKLLFGKNLRYLREQKDFTLLEMQAHTGFADTTWQGYESGRSFPKFLDFIKICDYFGLSETVLLHTDLSISDLIKKEEVVKNSTKSDLKSDRNTDLKRYSVGKTGVLNELNEPSEEYGSYTTQPRCNVYDLDSLAAAGVALFLSEGDKRKIKPTLSFPWLGPGIHIRIAVAGDSMHPTIKDQDKSIATQLPHISNLREGRVHIIFDKEEGVVCKRLYYGPAKNTLEFVSDNDTYKPYTRGFNDILGIFYIQEVHTTDLRPALSEFQKEFRQMKRDIDQIKSLLPFNSSKH